MAAISDLSGAHQASARPENSALAPGALPREIVFRDPSELRPHPGNARRHPKRQIRKLANTIKALGYIVPIVIDEHDVILKGHASVAAAKLLKMRAVPTLCVRGLSEAQKRVFMLADNRLAEDSGWDRERLALEFAELGPLLSLIDLDVTITGFEPPEIDMVFHDHGESKPDPGDETPEIPEAPTTQPGDVWQLGSHRIVCGDARSQPDLDRLMDGAKAQMAFTDPPYNLSIAHQVLSRGNKRHGEFRFASGEMTERQFTDFLAQSFLNIARVCDGSAIVFACMDWRHIEPMLLAGRAAFAEMKNLIVWNKTSPGQGAFYRSQHELIFVWKVGEGESVNAFGLGQHGRTRSNVWTYAGMNSFRAGRADELAMHPTVKPVALVADAMRDCSMKGHIVLDPFLGSGTTIVAAEKVGRRGFGVECDPKYVDVAIRRWQNYAKTDAVLVGDGRTFEEISASRRDECEAGPASTPSRAAPAEGAAQEATDISGSAVDFQDWTALCEPWPVM